MAKLPHPVFTALISLAALLVILAGTANAAPRADLWERWIPAESTDDAEVDHSDWNRFLKAFVHPGPDGVNRVDYGGVDAIGRNLLDRYIATLVAERPTQLRRAEAKAYWINLYNALTVHTILQHYPVKTIRDIDISPGLFSNGPWGAKLIEVEGVPVSLDDIEHRILRPIWNDPLIHYAVNCAAVGCPQLRGEAFVSDRLDAQLDVSARDFINHPRALQITDGDLSVSSIFEWFMSDFGETDSEVIEHIRMFADPGLAARLQTIQEIDGDFYDWSLNDVTGAN